MAYSFLETFSRRQHLIVVGLLVLVAITAFMIYTDYGFSWDEAISHSNGRVALEYVRDGNPELWTYSERYYGTLFEMPFAFIQDVFQFSTSQGLFFFRHIATFLFFLVGVYLFYRVLARRFTQWWIPLVGVLFLVVSPRIFADGFYNSKDIPFMVLFTLAMLTLLRFLDQSTWQRGLVHGLATGALIALRLPGVFVPALTIGFLLIDFLLLPETRKLWRQRALAVGIFLGVAAAATIALWPFLWQQPVQHFLEAFKDMSQFSRQLKMPVLHFGTLIPAFTLPWTYVPIWIGMTTPLSYVLLAIIGIGATVWRFGSRLRQAYRSHRSDAVALGWFVGPLCAVIILDSVLYDGWRHMYFLYPAVLYLALVGIEYVGVFLKAYGKSLYRPASFIVGGLIGVNVLIVGVFMVRNHPYQNLYFNVLASGLETARKNFDIDYWGTAYREGLEYIAAQDTDAEIPIVFAMGSPYTTLILPPEDAQRFIVLQSDPNGAKYILSNYRWQEFDKLPHDKEFYSVKVDGVKVMSVFKMR